jgi:hypothetical protein
MALRREPCSYLFPPLRTTKDIQGSLADGQALLSFFCTSQQTYGFLLTRDKYSYWTLAAPQIIQRHVVTLLRDWGNFDQNKELRIADLHDDKWKKPAREILDLLMKDSKVTLPYNFKELVIVPDNILWYVPFEALQVSDHGSTVDLITKLRVRYAPTLGLSLPDGRPRRPDGNMAVVLGRLIPNDSDEVTEDAFADIEHSIPGSVAIRGRLEVPSGLLATLFDRLIVLGEIAPVETPHSWSPVPLDAGTPGSTLVSWFQLPWGGPDQVMLPGFHTSAENALKHSAAGSDLFNAICGLMSTGTRTVLISRWRPGGQSSINFVREFAQELPHTTASDAWQRAVLLVTGQELDPTHEPRLNNVGITTLPKADHPFFWAGFLVADTGAAPRGKDEDQPIVPGAPVGAAPAAGVNPPAANPQAPPEKRPDPQLPPRANELPK